MNNVRRKWTGLVFLFSFMQSGNVQFAMPMFQPPPAPAPPMFAYAQPPPMYALPAPPPISIAVMPFELRRMKPITTTVATTTTEPYSDSCSEAGSMAVAVPVPVPMPVQFAVPAYPPPPFCNNRPRSPNCPPCPPCLCTPMCTPAFYSYCSPCHLKCRCRNKKDTPTPVPPQPSHIVSGPAYAQPMPMPSMIRPAPMIAQPMIAIPIPPMIPPPPPESSSSESETDCLSSSSSGDGDCNGYDGRRDGSQSRRKRVEFKSEKKKHEHSKRRRDDYHRRSRRNHRITIMSDSAPESHENDLRFVKPVLTFVAGNGDVKYRRSLNKEDVSDLIESKKPTQKVSIVLSDQNGRRGSQLSVSSQDVNTINTVNTMKTRNRNKKRFEKVRNYQERLTQSNYIDDTRQLSSGKTQLVFQPAPDQKISNFSLMFNVS